MTLSFKDPNGVECRLLVSCYNSAESRIRERPAALSDLLSALGQLSTGSDGPTGEELSVLYHQSGRVSVSPHTSGFCPEVGFRALYAAGSASRQPEVDRLTARVAELSDCGQPGVCALAPGCSHHWEERNRELVGQVANQARHIRQLQHALTVEENAHTETESELAQHQEDARLAAGELLVPLPTPGTDAARMMRANVLMRRQRDAAREELAATRSLVESAQADRQRAVDDLFAEAKRSQELQAELAATKEKLAEVERERDEYARMLERRGETVALAEEVRSIAERTGQALASAAPAADRAEADRRHQIADDLASLLYLYPHYRCDAREPGGAIVRALEYLHPEAGKALGDGEDAGAVYQRFFGEEADRAEPPRANVDSSVIATGESINEPPRAEAGEHDWYRGFDGAYHSHDWHCAHCGEGRNGSEPDARGCKGRPKPTAEPKPDPQPSGEVMVGLRIDGPYADVSLWPLVDPSRVETMAYATSEEWAKRIAECCNRALRPELREGPAAPHGDRHEGD